MKIEFICTNCLRNIQEAEVDKKELKEDARAKTIHDCDVCCHKTKWQETSSSFDERSDWTPIEVE